MWYFWTLRDIRSERKREEDLESLKQIEAEMERFSTLLATDPWLREYSRRAEYEVDVSTNSRNEESNNRLK